MTAMNWCATALFALVIGGMFPPSPVPADEDRIRSTVAEDPITALSRQLSEDPNEIFLWVRDNIHYECYAGSLRGPVGTFWARAGNSLDQCDLLATLLRRAGHRCRIVQTRLSRENAQALVLSMFPRAAPKIDLAEFLANNEEAASLMKELSRDRDAATAAEGFAASQPQDDQNLLNEAAEHFRVAIELQGRQRFLDPSLEKDLELHPIGDTGDAFETIPAQLQHVITVTIEGSVKADGQTRQTVLLEQQFTAVDCAERAISLEHKRSEGRRGVTYQPILTLGQHEYAGKRIYATAPSGSKLTGERVIFSVTGPGRSAVQHEFHALEPGSEEPIEQILSCKHTFVLASGLLGPDALKRPEAPKATTAAERPGPTLPFVGRLPSPKAVRSGKSDLELSLSGTAGQEFVGRMTLATLDATTRRGAEELGAVLYPDQPRIVAVSTGSVSTECVSVEPRTLMRPGQPACFARGLRTWCGIQADAAQTQVLEKITGTRPVSASVLLSAAAEQKIPIRAWGAQNVDELERSGLSESARKRIREVVDGGGVALWPERPVSLGDATREGGFLIDGRTGNSRASVSGQLRAVGVELGSNLGHKAVEVALRSACAAFALHSVASALDPAISPDSRWTEYNVPKWTYRVLKTELAIIKFHDALSPDGHPAFGATTGLGAFLILLWATH